MLDSVVLQYLVVICFFDLMVIVVLCFQWWKCFYVIFYLCVGGSNFCWVGKIGDVGFNEIVVVWGGCIVVGLFIGMCVVCIEDGFLYLVGFGLDMLVLYSQVFDFQGIYFDVICLSDLIMIFNMVQFDEWEFECVVVLCYVIV